MGLAAFQRMRIRQVEKMKPENIKKEQKEIKPIIEEKPKAEEVVVEDTPEVKEVEETATRRKPKANN